ncbi:hypothetical protein K1T71_002416 [Dendrolimus kikuchii]|uniref:Uncharacterized protein n=1 Tax=Dendrolimus kikuchii TaxID=765133 RepID=A0ACC1DCM6_9NEOP|nr:hypothetical protein K1T71_002416 [Dendrolimus kikuchii]
MNVIITSFTNPFSFFCITNTNENELLQTVEPNEELTYERITVSNADHGQYVAVMWRDKWVRGVISMEDQFLIWLIDYGLYIRPTEKTVYTKLPLEYKKYPSKVFEASIHGVVPITQILNTDCQIENVIDNKWTKAAIAKAKESIMSALNVYFQPIALLSYKDNNVVIGDLYLRFQNKEIINIVDILEMWPVYLHKNKEVYIKDLSIYYTTRRRHRACVLKPVFPNLDFPVISLQTALEEYNDICSKNPPFNSETQNVSDCEDGSTVLDVNGAYKKTENTFKLTTDEIEKYSTMFITVHGREYNVLQDSLARCYCAEEIAICLCPSERDDETVTKFSRIANKVSGNFVQLISANFAKTDS